MIFPTTIRGSYIEQMTDEEFFRFCQDNRDIRFERSANGQIIIRSPKTFVDGERSSEISYQLEHWNKTHKRGQVGTNVGFFLSNGSMRIPTSAWVSFECLNTVDPSELDKFPHLVPDFIVELKSKSDRMQDLKNKMTEWMSNGCRLGWLIDADEEVVYIYEGNNERVHQGFDTGLSGEPVLQGFSFVLSELRV